jgi:hypothetical protein
LSQEAREIWETIRVTVEDARAKGDKARFLELESEAERIVEKRDEDYEDSGSDEYED